MKREKIWVTIVAGVLMLLGVSYFIKAAQDIPRLEKLTVESKSGPHTFDIEIAATPAEMETGLMYREHMEPGHGMLFELGRTDVARFWMKNTLIPLDMLFIAPDGIIKKIHENAVPESLTGISSDEPVSGVLELNGGRARVLGITVGDRVVHPYFSVKTH